MVMTRVWKVISHGSVFTLFRLLIVKKSLFQFLINSEKNLKRIVTVLAKVFLCFVCATCFCSFFASLDVLLFFVIDWSDYVASGLLHLR